VETASVPPIGWQRLEASRDTSGPDRGTDPDRAAIRAMAGGYRVSFDFLETALFAGQDRPARPYRSWATEKVYIIDDTPGLISLQHVLVMVFVDSSGKAGDPMVMKHWRQDWRYEPESILEYRGNNTWETWYLAESERVGNWSQTVWHVDDRPRYGSLGRWTHTDAFSAREGNQTLRPLPRREYSVRSDYDVLDGTNRHTILPLGWTHEQDNLKHVLETDTERSLSYVSREYGVNRYEAIEGFDFEPGDTTVEKQDRFWRHVRTEWTTRSAEHARFSVSNTCEGQPAFFPFFDAAGKAAERTDEENQTEARRLVDCVFTPAD